MNEVYIEFEGTGREGSVAVGSYVLDAAKRLGVNLVCDCADEQPTNSCAVKVIDGKELLSETTKTEIEQLGASERKDRQRLACQTKIEKSGEIVLMTVKKEEKSNTSTEEKKGAEGYKKEFQEMPLEEKIASLVELEAIALGDTISFVMNSPYKAFGKVMDVMAGFGHQKEQRDKEAKVPEEHKQQTEDPEKGKDKKSSRKTATKKDGKPSKSAAGEDHGKAKKPKDNKEGSD